MCRVRRIGGCGTRINPHSAICWMNKRERSDWAGQVNLRPGRALSFGRLASKRSDGLEEDSSPGTVTLLLGQVYNEG
jgi:hypothetical protein